MILLALGILFACQLSPSSLRPAAGELGARAAVARCVRLLPILGYRADGKDAGMSLVAIQGRRFWRVELGEPAGARFSFDLDARTGLVTMFEDNGWAAGLDWAEAGNPRLTSQAQAEAYARAIGGKLGLPSRATLISNVQAGGIQINGAHSPRVLQATFTAPGYKYPVIGVNGLFLTLVMSSGRVVRLVQSYVPKPLVDQPQVTSTAAVTVAQKHLNGSKPLAKPAPRLVYIEVATQNAPRRRTALAWEVTFQHHHVYVDAVSGRVIDSRPWFDITRK